jgi:flagellar basal-body rod protein FlgG
MVSILDVAASGMQANQILVDVLANNVANINTVGFKEHRAEFQDLIYQEIKSAGTPSADSGQTVPSGVSVGLGVQVGSVYRINTQGDLQETSNSTDVAIRGKGYFRIEMPDGSMGYSRAGAFQLDQNGTIVNSKGYVVTPGIIVPIDATELDINESGQVYAKIPNQVDPQLLGQFDMATFVNEKGLQAIGDNLMVQTNASGNPTIGVAAENGVGTLLQGWLEMSNVNPVTQITQLIKAQRAYELCSTFVQAGGEILRKANDSRSG